MAAVSNLAFVVLTYLQPSSPGSPIVRQRKGKEVESVLNNPCGYVFPYGGLQFVPAAADEGSGAATPAERNRVGDGLADTVNDAISGAGFLKRCWANIKAAYGSAGDWVGVGLPFGMCNAQYRLDPA